MAYNFNQGVQFMSDISGSDDSNLDTGIDFEENTIKLVANDQESLIVKSDKVGIGTAAPKHRLHVSGSPGTVAGLVVGDFYVTGSRAKLIVEETNGSDYRVVIDPVSGPLINFGSDTADNHYMTLGAFSSKNNLDTATRDFHLYGTNTTTGFYFDESAGRFGIGTATPDYTLHVAGDIGVDQKITHNGDADTLIRFDDNQIILKAGNISMVKMEKNSSAPHEVTINDGSNNIDFVVKGNGSNGGNPGMKFDASTNKLGINGIGTPAYELEVAGDIGLAEYIYHRGDDDTFIRFEDDEITLNAGGRSFINLQEASTDKLVINNGGLDIDLQVKGANNTNLIRTDAANDLVGIATNAPTSTLTLTGSFSRSIATITGASNAIGVSHSTVLMDASSGNCKAQLPTAVGIEGRLYTFKRTDNSANQCIVAINGSETVDGMSGDIPIDTQYNSLTIQSNGSIWFIVAEVVYD